MVKPWLSTVTGRSRIRCILKMGTVPALFCEYFHKTREWPPLQVGVAGVVKPWLSTVTTGKSRSILKLGSVLALVCFEGLEVFLGRLVSPSFARAAACVNPEYVQGTKTLSAFGFFLHLLL